ncbi:MAG TPA: HD domain-containing protein [Chloroflexi bacterium]|jgi:metal-dependent HD superfamily phosphatase/phosphodiesterase|nr:HD domain-containing protein [Chloroflexota bacterium]
MRWNVPARHNARLETLLDRIADDVELLQLYKCANINAVDRSGMNDHGEVHVRIVVNAALRILRLLIEDGIRPSVLQYEGMDELDAEVIVVLAAALHDIGIAVHRDGHEEHSLVLAYPKARQLLEGIYDEPALTIMVAETLHAVISHRSDMRCLTIEAGVVKVADALDMSQGRSRIPFEAGQMNIHSVSALAVQSVSIERGDDRPVRISIRLTNSAGIFQIDELLKSKLKSSTLAPYVEVVARIEGDTEQRLFEVYKL